MRRLSYVTHDSARCLPVSLVLMYGTIPTEPFFVEDHPPPARRGAETAKSMYADGVTGGVV